MSEARPRALELADAFANNTSVVGAEEIAALLRQQHEAIVELRSLLQKLFDEADLVSTETSNQVRAALTKHTNGGN